MTTVLSTGLGSLLHKPSESLYMAINHALTPVITNSIGSGKHGASPRSTYTQTDIKFSFIATRHADLVV